MCDDYDSDDEDYSSSKSLDYVNTSDSYEPGSDAWNLQQQMREEEGYWGSDYD